MRRAAERLSSALAEILRRSMRCVGRSEAALRQFIRAASVFHLSVYRLTGGRVSGWLGLRNARILLLTTTGRRSGKPRVVPLLGIRDADAFVVVASYGGLQQPPAWWLNLCADPNAVIQMDHRTTKVRAEQADPDATRRLWERFVREFSGYEDYRNRTRRTIPIVILRPQEAPAAEAPR